MNDFIITKAGQRLVSDMVAGVATAAFTQIKTSDHVYETRELESLADLADIKQEALISDVTRTDPAYVELSVVLDNKSVTAAYKIRALGVYARDGTDKEILFAVASETDIPDAMPAYGGKTVSEISYRIVLRVTASDRVELTVNSAAYATVSQLLDLASVIDDMCDASLVDLGFARIFTHITTANDGLSYDEIAAALAAHWQGESTTDATALSSAEVAAALLSPWIGETSSDKTAIQRDEIARIIN